MLVKSGRKNRVVSMISSKRVCFMNKIMIMLEIMVKIE